MREVREETGLEIEIDRLLGIQDRYIPIEKHLSAGDRPLHLHQVFYEGHVTGGVLILTSDAANDRAAWIDLAGIRELLRVPGLDVALLLAGCGPATNGVP